MQSNQFIPLQRQVMHRFHSKVSKHHCIILSFLLPSTGHTTSPTSSPIELINLGLTNVCLPGMASRLGLKSSKNGIATSVSQSACASSLSHAIVSSVAMYSSCSPPLNLLSRSPQQYATWWVFCYTLGCHKDPNHGGWLHIDLALSAGPTDGVAS